MNCQNCGTQMSSTATVCSNCGTPVQGQQIGAHAAAPLSVEAKTKKGRGRKIAFGIWCVAFGIWCALSIALGIWVAWGTVLGYQDYHSDTYWLVTQLVAIVYLLALGAIGVAFLAKRIDFKITAVVTITISVAIVILFSFDFETGFSSNALLGSLLVLVPGVILYLACAYFVNRSRLQS